MDPINQKVTVNNEGSVRRSLRVEIGPEFVRTEFDRAYNALRNRASIRGFRKGKAPRAILEQRFGESVREDVVKALIERGCGQAIKDENLEIVANPQLVSQELSDDGEFKFEVLVEVKPEISLRDYKGIEYVRRVQQVDDDNIDRVVSDLRERNAILETEEDRVNVQHGDVLLMDLDTVCEGERLEEASGEGVGMEVGSGRFPEEFEKQIVGVTRGIVTPIDVHFPDDHQDEKLAGRLVRFNTTVKEIKNKILPPVDDDFVANLGVDDCDTIDDLRAKIREDLEHRADYEADRQARNELLTAFVDMYDFDVPEALVDRQIGIALRDMGINEIPDDKIDEVREQLSPQAIRQVRAAFLLDAVAVEEKLEIADEELTNEINRQLAGAGTSVDKLEKHYADDSAREGLRADMLRDRAVERLTELATRRDEQIHSSQVADP